MIRFPPLVEAEFIRRPNRFVVEVSLNGEPVIAHLHDPGRLRELLVPGATLFLAGAGSAKRKTWYDVILVKKGSQLVAIYSTLANRLVGGLLFEGRFPGLRSWRLLKTEPAFGNNRFDFELIRGGKNMYIEVKSVSLVEKGTALFPDAPTVRGRKHLLALAEATRQGYQATVVFVVTRRDASCFRPHEKQDPNFSGALQHATKQNVRVVAFKCKVKKDSMSIDSEIPLFLD